MASQVSGGLGLTPGSFYQPPHGAARAHTAPHSEQLPHLQKNITREVQRRCREDAGAAVSDEQMKLALPRYPVDRYLVQGSKKVGKVNIIDEDIWKCEPVLRPEDELMLQKLHEMLQSTAEDLKALTKDIANSKEPGVQVKSHATPLDEEFNEKVYIEEIVNAKFHGYKIIDNVSKKTELDNKVNKEKKGAVNSRVQFKAVPILKNHGKKNLTFSRTKVVQINEHDRKVNGFHTEQPDKKTKEKPQSVAYSEFSYKYDPKPSKEPTTKLRVQELPGINIRSELKQQNIFNFDIIPEEDSRNNSFQNKNTAFIDLYHETCEPQISQSIARAVKTEYYQPKQCVNKRTDRKISVLSACESSESTNLSAEVQKKLKTQKRFNCASNDNNSGSSFKCKSTDKNVNSSSVRQPREGIKGKLSSIYGKPTSILKARSATKTKTINNRNNVKINNVSSEKPQVSILNNGDYLPYSQLTLGGVRAIDIERELSNLSEGNDAPLTPIIDRILSSRENSFHKDHIQEADPKIPMSTSDENLLEEVRELKKKVITTISHNNEKLLVTPEKSHDTSEDNQSYDDDFEEGSENNNSSDNNVSNVSANGQLGFSQETQNEEPIASNTINDETFVKSQNLSFKDTVDIYEFVHSIDVQDNATQIVTPRTSSLKETQTSPRSSRSNIQPIHNDLWPLSSDSASELNTMFKLEKELIKKYIIEEYGDLLQKGINAASTSNQIENETSCRNVTASQKNTQTSPARAKSAMTSPIRSKTRSTSPFTLNLTIDHQTSPFNNKEEKHIQADFDNTDHDELGISINLSSPRFSLRLPQSSREVLSNLEIYSHRVSETRRKKGKTNSPKANKAPEVTSSTSLEASSSEISSLGEIKLKLRRRRRKEWSSELSSETGSSSSSSEDRPPSVLPLRSDGETSRTLRRGLRRTEGNPNDDDSSLGQL